MEGPFIDGCVKLGAERAPFGVCRKRKGARARDFLRFTIYHLSVKPVRRAAGHCATAAAAYRAGELVVDHTTGHAFGYTCR
jgi:hypothetical protein